MSSSTQVNIISLLTGIVLRAQGAVGRQPTAIISEEAGHVLGIVVVEAVPNIGRNVKDIWAQPQDNSLHCMAYVYTADHSLTCQTVILSQQLVEYSEFLAGLINLSNEDFLSSFSHKKCAV